MNAVLWSIPAGSAFPQHLHGREVLIIGGTYAGAPERGHEILRPLREFDEPLLDMSATIPYLRAPATLRSVLSARASSFTIGRRFTSIGSPTTRSKPLSPAPRSRPSQRSLLAIWALGGAMSRVGKDDTPIGNRSAPFLLEMIGTWSEAAQTEQNVVWVRHVFETMHLFSSGKVNANFSGAGEDNERFVRAAFGDHYQRLAKVKHAYDPTNMFRLNQNISVDGV